MPTATARQQLPAEPGAVPRARRMVTGALQDWGLVHLVDTAALLTSELATNVLLHARTPMTVEVTRDEAEVRVQVSDDSAAPPQLRALDLLAVTGRGLRLVADLAVEWGVQPRNGDGKTVWFALDPVRPPDAVDDGIGLAGFADVDWLAEVDTL